MKRPHGTGGTGGGHEDARQGEDSSAEMDVEQDEEKMIDHEDDDDTDADDEDVASTADPVDASEDEKKPILQQRQDNPFLDSFYGIASANIAERTQAAKVLLHHCLLGPDANAKDAAYALKRLLNGLCSGRAAARQGNAAVLASFLKVAFALDGKMEEIRQQHLSQKTGRYVLCI